MLLGEYKYHYEGNLLVEELPDGSIIKYDKNSGEIISRCTVEYKSIGKERFCNECREEIKDFKNIHGCLR